MHPFINLAVRLKYRDLGYDPAAIRAAMRCFSSKMVKQAATEARAQLPNESIPAVVQTAMFGSVLFDTPPSPPGEMTGAFGDGSIIEAIMRFFDSPLGQLIMQILMMLLMG